jgi:hypothetical protein
MAAAHHWHVRSSRARRDLGHGRNARRNRRIYSLSASRCDGEGVKVGWIVRTPYDIVSIDMTLSLRVRLAPPLTGVVLRVSSKYTSS